MKTAISVPNGTFRRVEQRAGELGMNRSEFFTTAAERYLSELDNSSVVQQIDEAIARGAVLPATDVTSAGLARLDSLTAGDEW